VAKIYDGVDYPKLDHRRRPILPFDCMFAPDCDYAIEAYAYDLMHPVIGGTIVPAYFGAWTFSLDTGRPNQQRWVRMILMELVQGECMLDMMLPATSSTSTSTTNKDGEKRVDYSRLPPEPFRFRVLQNILEAEIIIPWETGIRHEDVHPRNIIVKPDGSVVLIDFNRADIDFPQKDKKDHFPTSLPPSPMVRNWPYTQGVGMFRWYWPEWLPQGWDEMNPEPAAEWLIETYRNTTRFSHPTQRWLDDDSHKDCGATVKVLRLLESIGRKPTSQEEEESPGSHEPQPSSSGRK
jgi:serine/threonine protein kinase